jgi:hypothetical protein
MSIKKIDQALDNFCQIIERKIARPLTEVEIFLLYGALNHLTYKDVAKFSGYSLNYLQRDTGPKFWNLLSDTWGYKINKTNLRGILTNYSPRIVNFRQPTVNSTDWGEAIDVNTFHGRVEEINTLTKWITDARCRTIALLGMGGMGKSSLAAKVAHNLQGQFEFVIWRSLRHAPSLETLLTDLVAFLSNQQETQPKLTKLLNSLRKSRCLIILDNLETLLNAKRVGQFRAGFENYGELLQLATEVEHQSCILLTSREKPAVVATFEGIELSVRSLKIDGSPEAAQAIIQGKELVGTHKHKQLLGDRYSNCPLAVKIVATSIQELFGGSISDFLQEDTLIFNGIRRLLDHQFQRLSTLEKSLMYLLAINREWTTLAKLQTDLIPTVSKRKLLESLEALSFRGLIQGQGNQFTQQPIVMEYITQQVLDLAVRDLEGSSLDFLSADALLKAKSHSQGLHL